MFIDNQTRSKAHPGPSGEGQRPHIMGVQHAVSQERDAHTPSVHMMSMLCVGTTRAASSCMEDLDYRRAHRTRMINKLKISHLPSSGNIHSMKREMSQQQQTTGARKHATQPINRSLGTHTAQSGTTTQTSTCPPVKKAAAER